MAEKQENQLVELYGNTIKTLNEMPFETWVDTMNVTIGCRELSLGTDILHSSSTFNKAYSKLKKVTPQTPDRYYASATEAFNNIVVKKITDTAKDEISRAAGKAKTGYEDKDI